MIRTGIGAVALALLVALSGGAAVAGLAAGSATDGARGTTGEPQDADSRTAADGPPVVLQNVTVGDLELANVTLESVVIEELVVQSSQVEEGDEVPGLNETNGSDGGPVVFRGVAFDQLTLQSVSLSDLDQSTAGPLLNATGVGADANETGRSAGEPEASADGADQSAKEAEQSAGEAEQSTAEPGQATGSVDENVTVRNLTIRRMTVADLRISNLTVTENEAQQGVVDAIAEFVSGLFEGDESDGEANETNRSGAADETGEPNETGAANDSDRLLGGDGANESDGPIEEAIGSEEPEGEVIDALVVENLSADRVAVERMVVRAFRSDGTESIEETPAANETDGEGGDEGLLGGNETPGGENETGAEPGVATVESVSVGEVAIEVATADIWVIGETEQRDGSDADAGNETGANAANGTGEPAPPMETGKPAASNGTNEADA